MGTEMPDGDGEDFTRNSSTEYLTVEEERARHSAFEQMVGSAEYQMAPGNGADLITKLEILLLGTFTFIFGTVIVLLPSMM